jgi:hypothetical protein
LHSSGIGVLSLVLLEQLGGDKLALILELIEYNLKNSELDKIRIYKLELIADFDDFIKAIQSFTY